MQRRSIVLFITTVFLLSNLVNATVITKDMNAILKTNDDIFEIPEWNVGNYWKYFMDFDFSANDDKGTSFSVDAKIENMYATIVDIVIIEDKESYLLSLDGDIQGDLSLFSADIHIANFRGDFGGFAYIGENSLGIKKFEFEVDGEVNIPILGWRDMHFDMYMDFKPCFDFFDFPIDPQEEPWDVHIDEASLYAHVDIDVPFGESEYNSSIVFNDIIEVNRTENVNNYNTIVLDGSWGDPSNLWYSPDAGYLVKVEESLLWDDGYIESVFNLDLLDTNYDKKNKPPNEPMKPIGETDLEVKEEYSFETETTDPNLDDVYYLFNWGDGTETDWLGPYPHGTKISASHKWYNKGVYNVKVKAKDVLGIESEWSEALSVLVKGDPNVDVTIEKIEKLDEIDWDPTGGMLSPEWYYEINIENSLSPPKRYHNTDDGTYNGEWYHKNIWEPQIKHNFKVNEKEAIISIKLMDHDEGLEGENDDLADVSGCNVPDNNGKDDIEDDSDIPRGAIFYCTYNLIEDELKPYNEDPDEKADIYYEENGVYITCGDNMPDRSTRYENGMKDPENDAKVIFKLENDYKFPIAKAETETDTFRPYQEIQFNGIVIEGTPDYMWHWDFDDGTESYLQNPVHIFDEPGTYNVEFTVTDGFGQIDTFILELNVVNHKPILTKDKVEWTGSGKLDDTFSFSVHYLDSDSDLPAVKNVIIDGKERKLSGSGSNSFYTLNLKGSDIGKGQHSFYFYFEDGYGGNVVTSEKTFKVSRVKTHSTILFKNSTEIFESISMLNHIIKFLSLKISICYNNNVIL